LGHEQKDILQSSLQASLALTARKELKKEQKMLEWEKKIMTQRFFIFLFRGGDGTEREKRGIGMKNTHDLF
jgi:hypothetical protein